MKNSPEISSGSPGSKKRIVLQSTDETLNHARELRVVKFGLYTLELEARALAKKYVQCEERETAEEMLQTLEEMREKCRVLLERKDTAQERLDLLLRAAAFADGVENIDEVVEASAELIAREEYLGHVGSLLDLASEDLL